MREIPFRERKPRKNIEEDATLRQSLTAQFPAPNGTAAFKEGYRECIEMFALHAPNKRNVMRILDEHCITLEQACLRNSMARDDVSRYEGFRQAVKDLVKARRIR